MWQVVAPDMRGHGASDVTGEAASMERMADDVYALVESLGGGRVVLVGLSMGGYVALAYMKKYAAGFPPAIVARDQLKEAVAELSTHDNQRVTKALNDGLQAALTGTKTPEQAMKDAQREAERILRAYK